MNQNIFFISLKFVLVDLIGEILYFPLWWYGRGLKNTLIWCFQKAKRGIINLGIGIWLKNIFTPMYGQYDIVGRIISFFIRLAQIIARSLFFILWLILLLLIFIFYLVLPLFVLWQIITQLTIY